MELSALREVQGLQLHDAVFLVAVRDVDPLVDGEAADFPVLMVDMRAKRGNTVRAERKAFWYFAVAFKIQFITSHFLHIFLSFIVVFARLDHHLKWSLENSSNSYLLPGRDTLSFHVLQHDNPYED